MSPSGHGGPLGDVPPATILVGAFDLLAGQRFTWHDHREHQLVWASSGVVTVTTATGAWVLPPSRGLWLPAGVRHATAASTPATVLSPYFVPAGCPIAFTDPTVVQVDELLAKLIRYLARPDLREQARARAEAVVFDLVEPVPVAAVQVAMPHDTRAQRIAEALAANPADDRDLATWGRHVGASARTLARIFVAETGLSFGRWRSQVRLRAALVHLAAGMPVQAVAPRVGYHTPSAFVAAFRQAYGLTPGSYFDSTRRAPARAVPGDPSQRRGLKLQDPRTP